MEIEYEAKFCSINKEDVRQRLSHSGAVQAYPERLMRRYAYNLPSQGSASPLWARVRDEGDRITMSVKQSGTEMDQQKEIQVQIDNFEKGAALLRSLGCREKAYQETRRELWTIDGCEVTIDEWPFLPPGIEIEGPNESAVRAAADKLGFAWDQARFCAIGAIYAEHYGIPEEQVNDQTPRIVFGEANPFI